MNLTGTRRLLCILFLLLAPSAAGAEDWFAASRSDAIQALLRNTFAAGDAGMVIALLDEGGGRVFSAGTADAATGRAVDGDTVFEIGSISKTFTVLLLLELDRRGDLKLDDPVSKYLPDGVRAPSFVGKQITLLNLAAQDSGLPFNADNLSNEPFPANYNAYTVADLYAFLSQYELPYEPGAQFGYSNVGMSLLGHVMELATDTDYESLVVARICRPLAMTNTRVSLTPEMTARLATGHDRSGQRAARMKLQVMAGAGALHSTAEDLLKYLAAQLAFQPTELSSSISAMQVLRHADSPDLGKSAMPWYDNGVYNPPGSELWGHSGGTAGFSTFVGFDKKRRRGVVVLSNQRALPSGGVGWAILQGMPLSRESFTRLVRQIEGIGAALDADQETKLLRITSVFPNSPAGQAGLSAGLLIRRINGHTVEGKSLQECLDLLSGPVGTDVRLEIVDPERNETSTLRLTKQKYLTVPPEQ